MKMRWLKRGISIVLTASMMLGLENALVKKGNQHCPDGIYDAWSGSLRKR